MKTGRIFSMLLILSLVTLLLGSCTATPGTPAATAPPAATTAKGTMQVYVTDAPPKGVTAVEIKASNVEAHMAGAAEDKWVTLLKDPPVFDLVKATGVNILLGSSEVAVGHYTGVRLDITEVTLTIDGKPVKATVPGDKLKLVGEITIEDGKQTSISLDFDAEKSVILEGKDKAALKPVVKLIVAKPGTKLEDLGAPATSDPSLSTTPSATASAPASTMVSAPGIAEVRATDAPPRGNITKVLVTVSDIEVQKGSATNTTEFKTLVSVPRTFDLLSIQGSEISLGQENLAPGNYTQFRLNVTNVVVTVDNKEVNAKVPSDKIKIISPFEVKSGQKTILTMDFEVDKFVVLTGNGEAIVKPVIKLAVTHGDRPLKSKADASTMASVVSGTITYAEKIALDPAALITVKLLDTSKPEAPVVIGQQVITAGEAQVPFNFEISYNRDSIKGSNTYAVQADISLAGQKLFATDKDLPVITKGNPSAVDITLKKM